MKKYLKNITYLNFHSLKGWINDPNGLIYFKNNYHIFFQYNPKGLMRDTMNWGHAISKDLIKFKETKIALSPSIKEDKDGCFSGSSFIYKDKLFLLYTGIEYIDKEKRIFKTSQIITYSDDGFTNFNKNKKVLLISYPNNDLEARDPFILLNTNKINNDEFIFVLGSSTNKNGSILFYKLTFKNDKNNELNINAQFIKEEVFQSKELGRRIECPSLIHNNNFLITSSMDVNYKNKDEYKVMIKDLNNKYIIPFDLANDLYASLPFLNKKKEYTFFSFIRKERPYKNIYTNLLSLPRIIKLNKDNKLEYSFLDNIDKYFIKRIKNIKNIRLNKYSYLLKINDLTKLNYFKIGKIEFNYDIKKELLTINFNNKSNEKYKISLLNSSFKGIEIILTPLTISIFFIDQTLTPLEKGYDFKKYDKVDINNKNINDLVIKRFIYY